MKKIGIIGAFGFEPLDTGGQPVKTRALYQGLSGHFGVEHICYVDTIGWVKRPIKTWLSLLNMIKKCDCLIMLPAQNGVKIFSRLLSRYQKKGKKVFYDVIGGWLPSLTKKDRCLFKCLQNFDGIWVETEQMRKDLVAQGLQNVKVVPNFKDIHILELDELCYCLDYPLSLCTFSRVIKEKGIEDAINVVTEINEKYGKTVFTLDIYGVIGEEYYEEFQVKQNQFPSYISYKGVAFPENSVEIIKNYFLLLFPTHFFTEGIPGTLIDAYCAGTPVVTSLWRNYIGVFDDGVTGYGYEFGNINALKDRMEWIVTHIDEVNLLKENCLKKAKVFSKTKVINQIVGYLEKK